MAFLVDVALSAGFSLLSGLLKPRKTNTTSDNYPTAQFGEPVCRGWGNFLANGVLCFAGDPSLNSRVQIDAKNTNNPEENASYAVFLHSNPASPSVEAIRINGLTMATRNIYVNNLTSENKNHRFLDGLGLYRFDQFVPRFYDGTQTQPDPMIAKNGFGYIVYRRQCYLVIADAIRSLYGGRGATVGVVLRDHIYSNGSVTTSPLGFNDAPAYLRWDKNTQTQVASLFAVLLRRNLSVPRGFQFTQTCAVFKDPLSVFFGSATSTVVAFGTGVETRLENYIAGNVTVENAAYAPTAGFGVAGKYNRVPLSSGASAVTTNEVIVAAENSALRSIFISPPATSPFISINGQIKDLANNTVGFCGATEDVMGWDNTIYTLAAPQPNVTANPQPAQTFTSLQKIISDLMSVTDAQCVFDPGFDEPVVGFTTVNKDVTSDISNLLAVYNRMVYQRRDGVFVFAPYPAIPATPIVIKNTDHVSEPEVKISDFESLPDGLDFSYRDSDREFDSASIRIGGDNTRRDSYSMDITAGRREALVLATNLLGRIRGQTITGSLHLPPEFNRILPGEVVSLQKLNPTGENLLIIINRVETGADCTVRFEFVNYYSIDSNPVVEENAAAIGGVSVVVEDFTIIVDTERRSAKTGLGYFTNASGVVRRGATSANPIVGSVSGTVESISFDTAVVQVKGVPVVGGEYYIFDTLTGYGSWCRVLTAVVTAPEEYTLTIQQGLYGSIDFAGETTLVFLQIFEETVLDDDYQNLDLYQNANMYTHTYPTRKRTVEPKTGGVIRQHDGIKIYRRSAWKNEDLNLSEGVATLAHWKLTNTTTNASEIISTATSVIQSSSTFSVLNGQSLSVQQVELNGQAILGAYTSTYSF